MIPKERNEKTPDSVRAELARKLGAKVRDDIWEHLVAERYVNEVVVGETTIDQLGKKYTELNRRFSPRPTKAVRRQKPVEVPADDRQRVANEIFAIESARRPDVVKFRNEVLGGRLMSREDIAAWVKQEAASERPTWWLKIPVGEGASSPLEFAEEIEKVAQELRDGGGKWPLWKLGSEAETLSYPGGTPRNILRERVRHDGILARVKDLGRRLSKEWSGLAEPEAAELLLTGAMPEMSMATAGWRLENGRLGQITLTVNPRMSADEVSNLYRKAQAAAGVGRDRPMSEKHLALAKFTAENRDSTLRWQDLATIWGERFPLWAYGEWRQFARDAVSAWTRLTGRKWAKGEGTDGR